MRTKIAVTGATGRIGTHIVDVITEQGHEVVPLSRGTGVDVITGEGLDAALAGVEILIDATTGPSPDEQEAIAFFTTAARNLQAAAAKAGVKRIVIISIVGTDRFQHGYNAGKNAQEAAILEGPVEARIVRAAQFHEFVESLMQWGRQGDTITVWEMQTQVVGARAAAEEIVAVALAEQTSTIVEVAGPRAERLVELARLTAAHDGDTATVEEGPAPADPELYTSGALLPGPGARLVGPTYADWLATTRPAAARR